jgi:hypothetical protein
MLNKLDIQELKYKEVDEYCDVCIGFYNTNYIVYVDSEIIISKILKYFILVMINCKQM